MRLVSCLLGQIEAVSFYDSALFHEHWQHVFEIYCPYKTSTQIADNLTDSLLNEPKQYVFKIMVLQIQGICQLSESGGTRLLIIQKVGERTKNS